MRVVICDDEEVQCKLLTEYLEDWGKESNNPVTVASFLSAEKFLFAWEEDKSLDLLILDIEMGFMSGMELAERIRKEDEELPILFVTGYEEYMAQGYEVSALHYLLKPLQKEKLFAVLDRLQRRKKPEEKIVFPAAEGNLLLKASDIWYLEAVLHRCSLHTADAVHEIRMSMGEAGKLFENKKEFVQCHRSYLVNLQHISAILTTELVLDDGRRLPVSRGMQKKVNEAFIRNYREGSIE